jgi:ADP-ribosylglycohydrolase
MLTRAAARFTDDTVPTVATASVLLDGGDYAAAYRRYARAYPDVGYGGTFQRWLLSDGAGPYGSWGNGAAMRRSDRLRPLRRGLRT